MIGINILEALVVYAKKRDHGTNGNNGTNGKD
jgi:hypothetical protein